MGLADAKYRFGLVLAFLETYDSTILQSTQLRKDITEHNIPSICKKIGPE